MSIDSRATVGRLVLAATPLGNPGDASARLRQELSSADVVAAEDTRRLHRLTSELDVVVRGRVLSYYDGNERGRTPQLLEALIDGQTVLLVTDAGMPSVSDPGYRLVAAAVEAQSAGASFAITVLPGPSAVTTALVLSGLPCDRFCFEGFLPRKPAERRRRVAELAMEPRTLIFFEAPHRLTESLIALAEGFGGDRPAAVCRELTKTYEEVRRGPLAELAEWARDGARGEITVVVAGRTSDGSPGDEAVQHWRERVGQVEAHGVPRSQAVAIVAELDGVRRREVYNAVVAASRDPESS